MRSSIFADLKLILMSLVLAGSTVFGAKVDRSKAPAPGPAPTIQLGKYESFELSNGLRVFVVTNRKIPRVDMVLLLDHAPVAEGDAAGYIEASGSLLRRGTKNRNKAEIDETVDFMGATLITSPNSIAAGSLVKYTPQVMEIMADIVLHSDFKQEELDKIKTQLISGIKAAQDDPDQIAQTVRAALLFGKEHPYGESPTEKTVANITLEHCRNYYETYFKPNGAFLALVGDISLNEAKSLVEKHLGEWQKGEVPQKEHATPKTLDAPVVAIVDKAGAVQTSLGFTNIVPMQPNNPDLIKADVMNTILGGSQFRLFQNLREDKGYTYGAYSQLEEDPIMGSFVAFAKVRNEVTRPAADAFLVELNRIRDELPSGKEVQTAINSKTGSFARSLENPATIAQFAIDTARYDLPADYYSNYLKNLAAVTPADVQEMAKKYVTPGQAYILAVGNAEEIEKAMEGLGKIQHYDAFGNPHDPNAFEIPAGVNASTIISKYLGAIGGKEAIKAIQTAKMKGKLSVMGMSLNFTKLNALPNKELNQAEMNGQVMFKQVTDGEKAQIQQMGQKIPVEGAALEDLKLKSYLIPELYYEKHGIVTTLTGAEMLDGKPAYKIKTEVPNGQAHTNYYDVESGLKVKELTVVKAATGEVSQVLVFGDYREVDGVKLPFAISQKAGGQSMEIKTETYEFNEDIPADTFKVE